MVQTYGRQSVDETSKILKKLHRVDLMQMFSETSSEPKVDEHQPPVFEKTVKEDVEHVLSETLSGLKFMEFEKFKWVLQLTYFQRSFTQIQWHHMKWATTPDELVHLMVMNQQPVEVTKEVLLDMNRTDLVERLMATDSGLQEHFLEKPLAMFRRLKKMTTRRMPSKTLERLSSGELEDFCLHVELEKGVPLLSELNLKSICPEKIEELMVKRYSKEECVKLTRNILKKMNRTDLVKRLLDDRREPKEEHSMDEEPLSLTQRVEKMTSVIELLVEIMACLTENQYEEFKKLIRNEGHIKYIYHTTLVCCGRQTIRTLRVLQF
nr:uncharacterized protein LOC110004459 isoform X2 [Labrus bergylta]